MPAVDANPDDLEKFASQLTNLQKELEAAVKKTQSSFASLKWNDSERRKFGDSLDNVLRSVRSASGAIESLPKVLRKKAMHLREFQR